MTEKAVATYKPQTQEVATDDRGGNLLSRDYTQGDVAALRSTFGKGLSDPEIKVVVEYARRTGLDPITKEIHAWNDGTGLQIAIGIDGLRRRAMETGLLDGIEQFWCGPDGVWKEEWISDSLATAAKAIVYRRGMRVPFRFVVRRDEFIKKNAKPGSNHDVRPNHALGIAALRHCLRQAFPREIGGIFDALPRNVKAEIDVVDEEENEIIDRNVPRLAAPVDDEREYAEDAIDVPAATRPEPVRPHLVQSTRPAEDVFAEDESTPWDEEAPDEDMILAAVDEAPPPPEALPAPAAAPAPDPEPEQPKAMPRPGPKQLRVTGMLTAATGDWLTIERDQGSPVTIRVPADYAGLRPSEAHVGNGITVIVSGKQAPFTLEQVGSIETPNRAQGALV